MRVSFALTYSNVTQHLDQDKAGINKLSTQVSSGIRLQEQGDDPWAWSQALLMKQNIRESQTFKSNIQFAQNWNNATENALSQLSDLLVKAKQIATGSISANGQQAQLAQSDAMNQILEQAKGLVNTQFGNSYIFGGRSTSTAPFQTSDSTAADYLDYQGDTDQIKVRVGKDLTDTVNLDGQTAFSFADPTSGSTTNILKMLKQARDAIATSASSGDTTAVSDSLSSIDAARDQVSNCLSVVGTRLNKLENQQSTLQDLTNNQQTALSGTQDTDMATAITQLQQKQTAFQAALQVTVMVGKLNLTQYL